MTPCRPGTPKEGAMLRLVFAAVVLTVSALGFAASPGAALAEDTVFRCGGETVSIGDSRYTVQKICGKPTRSEPVSKSGRDRKPKKPKGTASSSPPEKLQKWTYDRGYGDYVYVLTFANDRLKRIETSGRGR